MRPPEIFTETPYPCMLWQKFLTTSIPAPPTKKMLSSVPGVRLWMPLSSLASSSK
jgi:hypothetical protein